ncbi:MAG: Uma2 family endonuclease [Planctomycetaceae bacterium]
MSTAPKKKLRMTAAEYLEWERKQDTRHEFHNGEAFAMAGGTRRHALIGANLVAELRSQLKGGDCESLGSDMQVYVERTGLYTYPDASVVCPPIEGDSDYLVSNPVLIGEVLSPSTADYDRGTKFAHYRKIASLTDFLVLYQEEPRVEHHSRTTDGNWLLREVAGLGEGIEIGRLGINLRLAEIYAKVQFDETAE